MTAARLREESQRDSRMPSASASIRLPPDSVSASGMHVAGLGGKGGFEGFSGLRILITFRPFQSPQTPDLQKASDRETIPWSAVSRSNKPAHRPGSLSRSLQPVSCKCSVSPHLNCIGNIAVGIAVADLPGFGKENRPRDRDASTGAPEFGEREVTSRTGFATLGIFSPTRRQSEVLPRDRPHKLCPVKRCRETDPKCRTEKLLKAQLPGGAGMHMSATGGS